MNKDGILGIVRHVLTTLGSGLATKGYLDENSVGEVVGAIIVIVSVIWSTIEKHRKKSAAVVSTGGLSPGSASVLLLLASLAFVGCQTTNPAGRALATASITAEDAVKGWLVYVETSGQVTPEQEAKVEAAYERFRVAKHIATSAYAASVKAGDLTVYDRALDALNASKDDLLLLISQFSTKGSQ